MSSRKFRQKQVKYRYLKNTTLDFAKSPENIGVDLVVGIFRKIMNSVRSVTTSP